MFPAAPQIVTVEPGLKQASSAMRAMSAKKGAIGCDADCNCDRYIDAPSMPTHPDCLEVIDPFSSLEAAYNLVEFVEPFWWNEEGDRLPDDLLRGISVDLLRSRIPTRDDPIERLADDGVVGGVHQRGQPQPCIFQSCVRSTLPPLRPAA